MGTRGRTGRRWAAAALCVCLLAGLLPGAALAAEEEWTDGLDLTGVETYTEYTDGNGGEAVWDYDTRTLTLIDVTIDNQTGDSAGISYGGADPLKVAVRGDCSVSGTRFGILGLYGLTVEVEEDASLTATGGGGAGLGAGIDLNSAWSMGAIPLAVTVAQGGRLTASGRHGIDNYAIGTPSVTIENDGTLTATGSSGGGVTCEQGTVALSGTGTTLCAGGPNNYGVYGKTGVTVGAEVKGLAAGGQGGLVSDSGSVTNPGGAFAGMTAALPPETVKALGELAEAGTLGAVKTGNPGAALDLSGAPDAATYVYPKGFVQ